MKKKILILNMILATLFAIFIFLQIPVVKYATEKAIEKIESNYLLKNLTKSERNKYTSLKKIIIWNHNIAKKTSFNARKSGILICIIFIANNLFILKRK